VWRSKELRRVEWRVENEVGESGTGGNRRERS